MSVSTTPLRCAISLACAMSLVSACNHDDKKPVVAADPTLSIDMQIPNSLTGGKQLTVLSK